MPLIKIWPDTDFSTLKYQTSRGRDLDEVQKSVETKWMPVITIKIEPSLDQDEPEILTMKWNVTEFDSDGL